MQTLPENRNSRPSQEEEATKQMAMLYQNPCFLYHLRLPPLYKRIPNHINPCSGFIRVYLGGRRGWLCREYTRLLFKRVHFFAGLRASSFMMLLYVWSIYFTTSLYNSSRRACGHPPSLAASHVRAAGPGPDIPAGSAVTFLLKCAANAGMYCRAIRSA